MARNYASTNRVELADLLDFARERHHYTLVAHKKDGSPQASPVSGGVSADGRLVISSYPQRAKAANLRRDGRATVVVHSDDWDGPYVQIDGTAEVLEGEDAVEPLVEYFRCIAGEHDDWEEYRQAMRDQGKCLIRITPEQWGPIATGGFPRENEPRGEA